MPLIVRATNGPSPEPIDWQVTKDAIVAGLDVAAEYAALRLVFSRPAADPRGRRECHAIGREDASPSAFVNVVTGVYHDSGGEGVSMGFLDFALKYGNHGRWIDVVKHYAAKAGVVLGQVHAYSQGRIREAIYLYRDATGTTRYAVFRYVYPNGKKTFTQHPPDGKGGWVSGAGCMEGVAPVPYRLPELLAADASLPVLIVEGEKDAARAASLGFVATTNHGGSNATEKTWPNFVDYFRARDVVVIPDNDATGRAHALRVCTLLAPGARSVRLVELPGLPAKGDLSTWLDLGHDVDELRDLIASAPPFDPAAPPPGPADEVPDDGLPGDEEVTTVRLGDVEPREVEWLFPGRVPLGKITLVAGDPGLGKSFLTMDLIARVTTNGLIPAGGGECVRGGSVVLLSAEDDLADTIRPRLDAAGADVDRVHALTTIRLPGGRPQPFDLTYLPHLERAIVRSPDCRLVVIDPVTSYVGGGVDDYKGTSLRTVLGPLCDLAARRRVSVVIVTHLNKGSGTKALNRITGSISYAALARAAWLVIRDADDPGRRLFLSVKNNLAPDPSGLAYRIIDGRVVWEDTTITMTANDAMCAEANPRGANPGPEGPAPARDRVDRGDKAVPFLRELLARGVEVASDDVYARGKAAGHSRNALFEGKDKLGVRARKTREGWVWFLPPSIHVPAGGGVADEDFVPF